MADVIERVVELEEQVDGINQRFDRMDASIARVEARLDAGLSDLSRRLDANILAVNQRLDAGLAEVKESIVRVEARLDTGLAGLSGRLDANMLEVRGSIAQLGVRMDSGFSEMRAEMRTQFRWFMGGLGGAVVAMLLTIFGRTWLGS